MTVASRNVPRSGGWRIVAAKELADHLRSVRFFALMAILGLAAAGAVYAAAGGLTSAAQQVAGTPALFLQLFTVSAKPLPFSFVVFVGFLAPLVGIGFGFDAINGERAQGTLPALVSQPIYRDDVINGKFAAGIGAIGLTMTTLVLVVGGIGIVRLGVVPTAAETTRLVVWLATSIVYVGFWLGFATLCSVVLRRASTSALVAIAAWLVLALFAALLAQVVANAVAPVTAASPPAEILRNAHLSDALARLSPTTLYDEATAALLNPSVRTFGLVTFAQLDRAVTSNLTLVQSLLLVWPQLVGLVALTVVCFGAAYVTFMRQEIRA